MNERWILRGVLPLMAVAVWALAACGGGSSPVEAPLEGSRQTTSLASTATGTDYPLSIYLPPASAGPRSSLPVLYVLDGESWFETLVGLAESTRARLIIVAIGTAGQRNRDFVPPNSCTPSGGGQAAYARFLRDELLPHVARTVGGAVDRRILFGHSHGGSFALFMLFSERPGQQAFSTYLASDSSIGCLASEARQWEESYASTYRELPVRLQLSYATAGNYLPNLDYGATLARRGYGGLTLLAQAYSGSHSGIVPQVLSDGIAFALAGFR